MFAVDFEELSITELNGLNDFQYSANEKYDSFKEAKDAIVDYWQTMLHTSKLNIAEAKKLKN